MTAGSTPGAATPGAGRGWSVYVHFPYCLHRCAYCDFATAVVRDIPRDEYLAAILTELAIRTRDLAPGPVETVFFGGGTPSLWGPDRVGDVLGWLDRWGGLPASAEVTLEANPGAVESGVLADYAAAGINRVSVGIQALDDARLRALDRLHDAAGARRTLAELGALLATGRLRSASADLIFGGPGQTLADLRSDVAGVLDHGLPHLSAYSLTVEADTPLEQRVRRGLQAPPDDDLQADMLEAVPDLVRPYGLERYEVSNFARPGHASRHNLAYWTGRYYLAAGVGAHGFLPPADDEPGVVGHRYGNARQHQRWLGALQRGVVAEDLHEAIDVASHVTERLLTGLRLDAGLDLAALRRDLGAGPTQALVERARQAIAAGMPLEGTADRLRLTPDGVRVLDRVLLALA